MKICMFCHQFYPTIGGAERQAQLLGEKLIYRGYDVFGLTSQSRPLLPLRDDVNGIPVFRYRYSFFGGRFKGGRLTSFIWMVSIVFNLIKMIHKYDIIHAHLASQQSGLCALIAKILGKRMIVKIANTKFESELLKLKNNKLAYGPLFYKSILLSNRFICTTKPMVKELEDIYGIPHDQIEYIPNGVEIEGFETKIGGSPKISPDNSPGCRCTRMVLFIGRLTEIKNPWVLLRAAKRLKEVDMNVRVDFCGDGPLYSELTRTVREYGMIDRVILHGAVSHTSIIELLKNTDIFVLSSKVEGLSNALLEAMACGAACICSNIPSNHDLISPNNDYLSQITCGEFYEAPNGLLFEPDDHIGLSNAIQFYNEHEDVRRRKAVNAYNHVVRNYSINSIVERYEKLYADLLA